MQAARPDKAYALAARLYGAGDLKGAEEACRLALKSAPRHPDALHLMGLIATTNGRHRAAIKMLKQAVSARPAAANFHCNLALALQNDGKAFEALQHYKRALDLDPKLAQAHTNMGNILKEQGKEEEAMQSFDAAIALAPGIPAVHYNRACLLYALGRAEEAEEGLEKTLSLDPGHAQAHNNLGLVRRDQGRTEEAEACFLRALSLAPKLLDALTNLGGLYTETERHAEAATVFEKLCVLDPGNAQGWYKLAYNRVRLSRAPEAVAAYDRCLALDPRMPLAFSHRTYELQHMCDWDNHARDQETLCRMIHAAKVPVFPFITLTLPGLSPAEVLASVSAFAPRSAERYSHAPSARTDGRIRVGYFSADLHSHATAALISGMIEAHDREKFEIVAYSFGPDTDDDARRRLKAGFDSFIDIRTLSHDAAARRIHDDGVDILVDLKGHTAGGRPEVLARRPAPVQVSYLGYPGTLGMEEVDYVIADPFVLPMDQQEFYAEKIVHLPHSYQPNDRKREIAPETPTRAACGLPEKGFVFCSFNSPYKYTPPFFDIWMRLLEQVEGSVLWLYEGNAYVKGNLEKEARKRGADPARLVFAPRAPLPQHLARQRNADLFLDSLPYNAHTTASDALWAGLPLVTCAGDTFAGRVAGSLLRAVGLPDLITHNLQDYEALALKLAREPALLKGYKDKLAAARDTAPLFDTQAYTRDLEKAYEEMWRRFRSGETPVPFVVSDLA